MAQGPYEPLGFSAAAEPAGAADEESFWVFWRERCWLSRSAAAMASAAWLSGFGSAAAARESPGGGAEAMVDGVVRYCAQRGCRIMDSEHSGGG